MRGAAGGAGVGGAARALGPHDLGLFRLKRGAWEEIDALPPTLVHNDFNPRNLALVDGGTRLVALDWELATVTVPQRDVAELLVRDELRGAPGTSLNVRIGRDRRLSELSVPLDEVKAIKRELGGTVNDVVLAGCAGEPSVDEALADVKAQTAALVAQAGPELAPIDAPPTIWRVLAWRFRDRQLRSRSSVCARPTPSMRKAMSVTSRC